MVQQINLINPALRKKRDLLTAVPLSIALGIMLAVLLAVFFMARQQANTVQAEADKRAADVKTAQARMQDLAQSVASMKPNPQLAEELANSRAMLTLREEVISAVEGGAFGKNSGFSGFMRGFAHQVPNDLWLTGFILRPGGDGMEIRGRMLKPTALPEFIGRLNSETAFQGLGFSSLLIDRPPAPTGDKSAASTPGSAAMAVYVEFVMRSKSKEAEAASSGKPVKAGESKQ